MILQFAVPGEPVGKRVMARALKMGNIVRAQYFIQPEARKYIELVAAHARLEVEEQGWIVPEGDGAHFDEGIAHGRPIHQQDTNMRPSVNANAPSR